MGPPKSRPVHRTEQTPPPWLGWGIVAGLLSWLGAVFYVV